MTLLVAIVFEHLYYIRYSNGVYVTTLYYLNSYARYYFVDNTYNK